MGWRRGGADGNKQTLLICPSRGSINTVERHHRGRRTTAAVLKAVLKSPLPGLNTH